MRLESLRELFLLELQDLYSAEKQLTRMLPKIEKAATDPELKAAIRNHQKETKQQVQRLDHIFSKLDEPAKTHRCKAMAGLLREAKGLLKMHSDPEVLDAGLISALQRIEHYEIAGYGTARTYAEKLGEQAAAELLQETLNEEGDTDKKLTKLAEGHINADAMSPAEEEVAAAHSQV
jgi:ferritin-like metal-binding protein YciE